MSEAQNGRSSSELKKSDPRNDDVRDIERRMRKAQVQEIEDANRYRARFFHWGVSVTTLCVLASIVILSVLVHCKVYESAVGVAFIGGLAVEVVGIAAIIAKYLFPNGGTSTKGGVMSSPSAAIEEEDEV